MSRQSVDVHDVLGSAEVVPDERSELTAGGADTYQAVSAAFARQDEADAAWVAADRAISAAELAGGRTSVIAGHFRLAHAFVRLGRYDQAEHVTTVAIAALRSRAEADDATVEELSLYGANEPRPSRH